MFKKTLVVMLTIVVLAVGLPGLALAEDDAPKPVLVSEPVPTLYGADYLVKTGDWLSRIAAEQLGDAALYPAIVLATNAKGGLDGYATITDPFVIESGWKLALPTAKQAQAVLSFAGIRNATYSSEWTKEGTAPLSNGAYTEEIMPDSASKIVVRLLDHMAFGYDAESKPMAAALLWTWLCWASVRGQLRNWP